MAVITITQFRANFKKYRELAQKEEILITKNGKPLAKLSGTSSKIDPVDDFLPLSGVLDNDDMDLC